MCNSRADGNAAGVRREQLLLSVDHMLPKQDKKTTHDISEEWLLAAGSDQRRGSALTAAEILTLVFVSLSRTYLRSCSSSCSPSAHSGAFNCCGDVRRGTEHPCAPRRVGEIEAIS